MRKKDSPGQLISCNNELMYFLFSVYCEVKYYPITAISILQYLMHLQTKMDAYWLRGEMLQSGRKKEPIVGVEPTTFYLQGKCSTTKLYRPR